MSVTYTAEYAAMITTIETNPRVIILDCIDETTVNVSSTLTSHPTVLGDNIADHMYREPISYGLSGTFSTNGSQGLVFENEKPSLRDVQKIFEEINDKGILCDIVKVKVSGEDRKAAFSIRQNMALTSISWREGINSLGFNFSFNEALQADVIENDVDITDEYLPNVNYPKDLSFTDALLDWEQVDKAVISAMDDKGLVTRDFLQTAASIGAAGLIAIGIGKIVASIVVSALAAVNVVPVIGQVITGVVMLGIFIYGIVKAFSNAFERKQYRVQTFEKYNDARKNEAEIKRFSEFIKDIHGNVEQLNKSIIVKQILSNEEQEVIVSIGDSFYTFTFLKNNTSGKYSLDVKRIGETEVDVKSVSDITTSPTNWYDCTTKNQLFNVEDTGEYVYLVYVGEDDGEEKNDLTKYYIVVSSISPDDFNKVVSGIIEEAFLY